MKEFVLPSLGADMDEGLLAAWLVSPGDTVHRGDVIAEVETDKGIIEVECWEDAVVGELLVDPGPERLAVGTPIAVLRAVGDVVEPVAAAADVTSSVAPTPPVPVEDEPIAHRISPPVRHLAHTLGVDVETVTGTGSGGVVTRTDVRHAAVRSAEPAPVRSAEPAPVRDRLTPRARRLAGHLGVDLTAVQSSRADGLVVAEDLMRVTAGAVAPAPVEAEDKAAAMRRAIGRSMERSKREIPHYYLGHTVDLSRAMAWLDAANEERPVTTRILPAVLLLKATATALADTNGLNGHMLDGSFTASEKVHLGVAVSLRGGGLVAPAIHDADGMSLDELMAALTDLVARARAGRLRGSEMTDATATVTNLGERGVDTTYPVIIPPQVAIVGFGRIADAPTVADGEVAVHPMVHVSLAADHRVTDGHTGGLFLLTIERLLQEPELL